MSFLSSLFGGGGGPDAAHVKQLVAGGALILDVRTPGEFSSGHVQGAVNIPVDSLPAQLDAVGAKDRAVIVYCRSGGRSARAASLLRQAGWREVVDVGPMTAFPQ